MFANIPIPSIFICFAIFAAWLHYERRKSDRKQERASREFWDRENEANHTKNKDISHLPRFCPDGERIPMPQTEDENAIYYQDRVRHALSRPMMNLSEYTNTDLKLAYGTGNFKTLSEYDENFNDFLMNLSNLAKAYFTAGLSKEAAATYELCLESGSDKATDYKALARVYAAMGSAGKIQELITKVDRSELPRKSTLVESLRDIQKGHA